MTATEHVTPLVQEPPGPRSGRVAGLPAAPTRVRRGRLHRWCTELALGMRLSVSGGRSGWARLAMIAVGVGLGVGLLLVTATLPTIVDARNGSFDARAAMTSEPDLPPSDTTTLASTVFSQYRDQSVRGVLLQPDGDAPPLPVGLERYPAPGELVVSPALADLLASDDGALLRERWGDPSDVRIGEEGLAGPQELFFYLGSGTLTTENAYRVDGFGRSSPSGGGDPFVVMLAIVGLVVLLLPVAVFVASAVRFGGEARDRQLAALRLVGADARTTRRVAAGETLTGAVLGLVVGGLLYVAVGLLGATGANVYLADYRPVPVLVALVVVLVPVAAVLVTLSAMRRVVVEPLGVVRNSAEQRRRLWWRLVLPVVGIGVLLPLRDGFEKQDDTFAYQLVAGVAALLVGVALLLPWLVEACVHRLRGGSVAWELAVRRLQLDSGTAVRAVSGIAVSVAGVIAVQGLLAAATTTYAVDAENRGDDLYQVEVTGARTEPAGGWDAELTGTRGVLDVVPVASTWATPDSGEIGEIQVRVGECAVLRQLATLGTCTDGDSFTLTGGDHVAAEPGQGAMLTVRDDETQVPWSVPDDVQVVSPAATGMSSGWLTATVLLTPGAPAAQDLGPTTLTSYYVAVDPQDEDGLEEVRNTVARGDANAWVTVLAEDSVVDPLEKVRTGLLVGTVALLALIGSSMVVNVVEQLRERRRLLAVLVAFGTRRSTLAVSVLHQIAIPVLLGIATAVAAGTTLSVALQVAAGVDVTFDLVGIATTSGAAVAVIVLSTAASLPLLWRLTRPGGLRSE